MSDRIAFTVRVPAEEYEALQALYYATIKDHRLSFNGWINARIADGVARMSADYPKHCSRCLAGIPFPAYPGQLELCGRCMRSNGQ